MPLWFPELVTNRVRGTVWTEGSLSGRRKIRSLKGKQIGILDVISLAFHKACFQKTEFKRRT